MKYLKVIFISLLCAVFGLTAPFVVPVALLFTERDAKDLPKAFAWYDTPDEKDLFGWYETTVKETYEKYGWFVAAWVWFGWRNRGHGFASLFSKEAPGHWSFTEGSGTNGDFFFWRKHIPVKWFELHLTFGWAVYSSTRYPTGFEYRPRMAIKTRTLGDK